MIRSANCSKGCKVEFTGKGWKSWNDQPIHPEYKRYLEKQQNQMVDKIEKAIEQERKKR